MRAPVPPFSPTRRTPAPARVTVARGPAPPPRGLLCGTLPGSSISAPAVPAPVAKSAPTAADLAGVRLKPKSFEEAAVPRPIRGFRRRP